MTTVPMTRSDAVGVMSERTRAMLRRVLSVRFSSWLYPSDESRSAPSTDEDGGRESAIDFPSKTRFLAVAPGRLWYLYRLKARSSTGKCRGGECVKVFVSVDMEGISGVTDPEDVLPN